MSLHIRYSLVLIPLLSLMAIAPSQIKTSGANRSPANTIDELNDSPYPKYEARAKKVDLSILAVEKNIDVEPYFKKSQLNHERVVKERAAFKTDLKSKADLEIQQKMLNEIVKDLVIQDAHFKELVVNQCFTSEFSQTLAENNIKETKILLEGMLIDVLGNVRMVAGVEMSKEEAALRNDVVAKVEVPKKDETVKKDDMESRLCEMEDKNKALLAQMNDLLTDQRKIIDIMLSIQQQMLQRPAFTPYYAYPQVQQSIYQYQPQQAQSAQYSLLPNSNAPTIQPNLFQQQMQPQQSMYQPIMGVSPQAYIEYDPRYSTTPQILPGAFGNEAMSFNFGQSQFQPQISMM